MDKTCIILAFIFSKCIMLYMDNKKIGRRPGVAPHIVELRSYIIKDLYKTGMLKQDLAQIFNIHPSQVSRALRR